jgi:anti-sigma factor RsiW
MMPSEPISDVDLQAYVDGQLDMPGRIEIERRLQAEPEAAARVMEELRLRDELRLFLADEAEPIAPATVALARELSRRLRARASRLRLRRAIAAAVLIGAGWLAHAEFGLIVDQVAAAHPVPALAAEAAAAVDLLRVGVSAGEVAPLRLAAPRTGGEVPIPNLGADAHLLRVQPVPTADGAGMASLYRLGSGALVSLLVAEAGSFAVTWPQPATVNGRPTVFWQAGPFAYALSGEVPGAELLGIARRAAPGPWPEFDSPSPTEGTPHG